VGCVALEVLRHPRAALLELLRRGAAGGSVLVDVALRDPVARPAQGALQKDDGGPGLEALLQEAPVGRPEGEPLQAKVRHMRDHQTVLVGVVHVVQLQLGVVCEQLLPHLDHLLEVVARLVGMRPVSTDWHEQRLRQPGHAEERRQVHCRSVGRADEDARAGGCGVLGHDPLGEVLRPQSPDLVLLAGLKPAAPGVDLLLRLLGSLLDATSEDRRGPLHDLGCFAEEGGVLALEVARERAHHGRGGVEVGDHLAAASLAHGDS
jgi:hypothetical protein